MTSQLPNERLAEIAKAHDEWRAAVTALDMLAGVFGRDRLIVATKAMAAESKYRRLVDASIAEMCQELSAALTHGAHADTARIPVDPQEDAAILTPELQTVVRDASEQAESEGANALGIGVVTALAVLECLRGREWRDSLMRLFATDPDAATRSTPEGTAFTIAPSEASGEALNDS